MRADRARFGGGEAARIWIGEESYSIEPLRVIRFPAEGLGESVVDLAGDISRIKKGRELTQAFLAVLEAEGGHIGKD